MKIKDLPKTIAIFPLSEAVFFPKTILPLNIFEDRYIQLVSDCMKEDRMFGMVQPKKTSAKIPELYNIGCLGKIFSFNETSDKRFIISLSGITRFKIKEEIKSDKLYRKFEVNYSDFINDLENKKDHALNYNITSLLQKIKIYFNRINYAVEFNELSKLNFDELVSTICMISPFNSEEKQKLIEAIKIKDKLKILDETINLNLIDASENKTLQ
jgi:uncharacterized protein